MRPPRSSPSHAASRAGAHRNPPARHRAAPPLTLRLPLRRLRYLHDHPSLLHGDIKSANVLVSRALDTIKLCDLGASLALAPADGANGVRLICSPEREMY